VIFCVVFLSVRQRLPAVLAPLFSYQLARTLNRKTGKRNSSRGKSVRMDRKRRDE